MRSWYDVTSLAGHSVLKTAGSIKESSAVRENFKNRTLFYYSACFQDAVA